MKLVFCGTPAFAVPTLQAILAAGHEVPLVLSQPDRAAGRGLDLQIPPVKRLALEHNLPVLQPERIKNNPDLHSQLEHIQPDAIVVVAYGRIIPDWMLSLPRLGNINLHGSLLPKYRGAAPVQWAVAQGETVTGLTTMRLDPGLDTGDLLLATSVPIAEDQMAVDVLDILAQLGAPLMLQTLNGLADGTLTPIPQDHSLATLAPILTREDGRILWSRSAREIHNRWRAFYPWPGAHTAWRGKKLLLHDLSLPNVREPDLREPDLPHPPATSTPGTLLVHEDRLFSTAGDNTLLEIRDLQIEGKRRITAAQFVHGHQPKSGEPLGP